MAAIARNRYLFTVEEAFHSSVGLILTPAPALNAAKLTIGSKIKLVFANKTEAETVIIGIVFEFQHFVIPMEWAGRVLPGMEVWSID